MYAKGPPDAFYLVKFWADISFTVNDEMNAFYGVDSLYVTDKQRTIEVSNKVCSFGREVVGKVEVRLIFRVENVFNAVPSAHEIWQHFL